MSDSVIFVVNFGFLLFLYLLSFFVIFLQILKKYKQDENLHSKFAAKMGLVILLVTLSVSFVLLIITFLLNSGFITQDLSNWVTIVIEIGIGLAIAILIALYSRFQEVQTKRNKRLELISNEENSREIIYSTLRMISEVINNRENNRLRWIKGQMNSGQQNLEFMNRKVARTIESLSFVLSINSANLSIDFVERIRHAIRGLDLILDRLEILPLEICDPQNSSNIMESFIDELKEIEFRKE